MLLNMLYITDAERNGRCPPLTKWGICPEGAATCVEDNDCSDDMKCCESPCGNICSKQLFTGRSIYYIYAWSSI